MPEEIFISEASLPPYGEPKMWYTSAELWSAIIAIAAFIAQGIVGHIVLPMEIQASMVTLWLFILRGFKTKSPIAWTRSHMARMKRTAV